MPGAIDAGQASTSADGVRTMFARVYLHLLALQWDGRNFALAREEDLDGNSPP